MPVKITKKAKGYQVSTPNGIKSKSTSLKNARKQERLLNAIEHGFKPRKRGKRG